MRVLRAIGRGLLGRAEVRELTSGSETANLLYLALPAVSTNFLQAAFNLVDIFWVGRLGAEALAAVSTATFLIWAIFSLAHLLSVGVGALVGRAVGAGEPREADRITYQGTAWSVIAGVAVAGGVPLLPLLFRIMGTSPGVSEAGVSYVGIQLASGPLFFLMFVTDSAFRSRGDARTPMRLLFIAVLLNLVLDPVLIFGVGPVPALGVAGAAWATVLSRGIAVVLALWLLRGSLATGLARGWLPHVATLGRLVRIGTPLGLSSLLFCAVYIWLARITAPFGSEALAALGVGHRVESLSYLLCLGFGSAAAALVAQNLGAGKPDRAAACARRAMLLLAGVEGVFTLLFLLLGAPIVRLFTPDALVVAHGASYLAIVAWSQVFMAMEILYEATFGGAGSTFPPMAVSVPLTAARIPLAWLLAVQLGWGLAGVWWAISLTTVAKGIVLGAWWAAGTWRDYRP
jgi:putative MATE family efflux protein